LNTWDLKSLDLKPRLPEILSSSDAARVIALDARLLLLLTPWPGDGHPGAMTIREKLYARRHAASRRRT
jgi:hypothetical protein